MKVVILCGGRGTRIRDVADDLPKPMIPLGGLPILWHIMKYYSHWGHSNFVLCLGYKGQVIKDFFLNYEALTQDFTITLGSNKGIEFHNENTEPAWRITMAETGLEAGTGARVKRIREYLVGEANFMLTYGDGVGNVDLDKLVAFHFSHGRTMTLSGVRPPGRFGELMSDHSGQVIEFNEKPQASGGRISGGFFVCRKELFDYLDDRENLTLEVEPMNQLVRDGQMMVYEHDGFWQPMDTYRDYLFLNSLCEKGQPPWKVW
ncbi:glucose-1-phosphate cytidylyltransferase [Nitrospiraceae bacterium AH_259_D15_M11_P09]|nr:glucose-1-phosphate cytidylyltransferase [Nitrospiraceae bacterium AH_259_D15_M11_P09]